MMQDVAFGTKVLKLDTGGSIIPAVIRIMIPSRIIEQYSAYCKEQNFEPAGQRSLYRIIEVCGASMQKSLQGLQNTTAEGTEAIDNVTDVLKTLETVLKEIESEINLVEMLEEHSLWLNHDFKLCLVSIQDWKAHLLCTVKQEEGKQIALEHVDSASCLFVMDWAMKYLRQRYQERMSDFFGKRGRSWHVSAVITKHTEKFQNSFAVASIIEHFLNTIKKESPEIENVFLRSDNAGCYHSGTLLHSLRFIEENGICAWHAFNVGPDRFLSYSKLEVVPQEKTGLKWGPPSNNLGSVSHASSPRGEIFFCSESTCVPTFKTREEAEVHMDAGKHVCASDLDCEPVYNAARKKWAN
ncbi:hypothetical protein P5673_013817 [Acropora cervicornis]|uniref:C2H2-type domain-containing protein n=1 Tax=Acropora cervicornis TaxID=6130 RepID=A0AAD9QKG2_ACRCE|nr:hypothetical protein P5673_013817 [Acropora cervicornis]